MRAQLLAAEGGPPIEITRDITVVGRKEGCDVRLDHKSVSKQHCVLVRTDGLLLLRDLGSTNGTRVNGKRVRRAALLPNDLLNVAGFGFKVYFGPAEAPASPHEQTQEIKVSDSERRGKPDDDEASEAYPPREVVVKVNQLPDLISGDEQKSKSGMRK